MKSALVLLSLLMLANAENSARACGGGFFHSFEDKQAVETQSARQVRVAVEKACGVLREKNHYAQAVSAMQPTDPQYKTMSVRMEQAGQRMDKAAAAYQRASGLSFSSSLCRPSVIANAVP